MDVPHDELAALRAEVVRLRAELDATTARQKRLADDLCASQAMHSATIESLPFDFWARDREGYVISRNSTTRMRWGEVLHTRVEDLDLPSDVRANWLANNRRALRGEIVRGEVTYDMAGETWHVHNIVAPIWLGDEIVGTMGVNIDLTELRRAEAERLRLERRLHETHRLETVGLLAGGVAHDINNIVMIVLATTSLARRRAAADAQLDNDFATIETASRRAAELCSQLLSIAGRGKLALEVLDPSTLVAETVTLVKSMVPPEIDVRIATPSASDLAVEVDAPQLRQLVMNLVLNASEAIGTRAGTITIGVDLAPSSAVEALAVRDSGLELDPSRAHVMLEVVDTGAGMSPDTRARIFEPFFSTKARGRGLGLAAALGVVRAHRGGLDVESMPGTGSTFRVFLPRVVRAVAQPSGVGALEDWRGSGMALIVDDDAGVANAAARMLRAIGFETIVASGGQEALALHRERPEIALVLLDLMMPGLDGAATLGHLRALHPSLPVVLMSGFHDLAEPPPRTPLLRKPFTVDELARTVRDEVGARAARAR